MTVPLLKDLSSDIYYQRDYSALYEQGCEYFESTYEEGEKYVSFKALKRRIKRVSGLEVQEELYDLETPYGYGGPLSNSSDQPFLQRAFKAYRRHCQQQRIVCEFIRFHPFNLLVENSNLFDMISLERQVVIVDLKQTSQKRRQHYSQTTRNIVKRAAKTLTVRNENVALCDFLSLYYDTMKKNDASEFFYFKEPYFESLMQIQGVSLLAIQKEHQYASIGFFMCSNELAHYHLSANNQGLAKDNGNYLLLDAAFEHAKAQGCRWMLLGGGRTSSPEDSLFRFKRKFSPLNRDFYIAGLDFLPEKKRQLNNLWIEQNPRRSLPELFQPYRA